MKKQEEYSVGASILVTIVFAIMAIVTYQTDPNGNPIAFIPGIGVVMGIIYAVISAIKQSKAMAREGQQNAFSQSLSYDKCFGDGDMKMYFDSSCKKVTICSTTEADTCQLVVDDFICSKTTETDGHLVALDSTANKLLYAKRNSQGGIELAKCCINDELKEKGIYIKDSNPTLKAYNDYAFVTDDVNRFVVIATPSEIHVLRYDDIVSVAYEENGNNVFNKSLGGAVVGGLLFGGVGAIVGGSTAKAKQNKEIRIMSIKILLKSTSKTNITLKIYEAGIDGSVLETKGMADRMAYDKLMKEVIGIKDIFSIIIDMVDKDLMQQKNTPNLSSLSIADELEKLAKLKESGILSEQEFTEQKKKLLNK